MDEMISFALLTCKIELAETPFTTVVPLRVKLVADAPDAIVLDAIATPVESICSSAVVETGSNCGR